MIDPRLQKVNGGIQVLDKNGNIIIVDPLEHHRIQERNRRWANRNFNDVIHEEL